MLNQFSRSELVFGKDAMERLKNARVAVFGIGGVGGYTVEALARSGIGALDLIDDDKVCITNLNRQILATVTGKKEIILRARAAGVPVISSMGAGNKVEASAFKVADIYKTSVCPLARVMRKICRQNGIDHLKVVYSEEKPIRPLEDMAISCRAHCVCPPGTARKCTQRRDIPGSTPFAVAAAGMIIAGEVVKDLTAFDRGDR